METQRFETQLLAAIDSPGFRAGFERIERLEPLVSQALDLPGAGYLRFALVECGQEPWNMRHFASEMEKRTVELSGNLVAFIGTMRELAAITEGQLSLDGL